MYRCVHKSVQTNHTNKPEYIHFAFLFIFFFLSTFFIFSVHRKVFECRQTTKKKEKKELKQEMFPLSTIACRTGNNVLKRSTQFISSIPLKNNQRFIATTKMVQIKVSFAFNFIIFFGSVSKSISGIICDFCTFVFLHFFSFFAISYFLEIYLTSFILINREDNL